MSESDDFLSRWSRRKREAAKEASLPTKEKTSPPTREETESVPPAADRRATTADASHAEPIFDLSKLPSLDSIGPETDLSIFMQPGVPSSLSHAALRRAWSADPAIRDFIGLSENSWDFTKPETISGFGPLLPIDDVKKLLARVLSDNEPEEPEPAVKDETAPQQETASTEDEQPQLQTAGQHDDLTATDRPPEAQPESISRCTIINPALQQNEPVDPAPEAMPARRHGGALPA